MENASKALIIAGAILLSILIIAIGIYIFNQANTTITSSMSSMSTQEKDAFNNEFTTYQGQQKGSNVKALLSKVASNLGTYKEEKDKVPVVVLRTKAPGDTNYEGDTSILYQTLNYNGVEGEDTDYTKQVSTLRTKVKDKNTYIITTRIGANGIVLGIAIGDITNMNATQITDAEDALTDLLNDIDEKANIENGDEVGF